jgi:hypothetical protein
MDVLLETPKDRDVCDWYLSASGMRTEKTLVKPYAASRVPEINSASPY